MPEGKLIGALNFYFVEYVVVFTRRWIYLLKNILVALGRMNWIQEKLETRSQKEH